MGCKIIFAPQTIADLEGIVSRIARDNTAVAERVGHALIDRVDILESFPLIGSTYPKRPGVRKLVSRPYLVFYRVNETHQTVEILRYWYGAQLEPHLPHSAE